MHKFHLMLCGLMLCTILSACQLPRPQPMVTPSALPVPTSPPVLPIPSTMSPVCTPHVSQTWSLWRTTSQPTAVQSLLVEQGTLWAGTPFGVFRVDPGTGVFTHSLDYETSGGVSKLFPLGEGHLWAEGERGQFYYDGKEWRLLHITGTHYSPSVWAIDVNGDLWLMSSAYRQLFYFRLPGHIPPPQNQLWQATEMQAAEVWMSIGNCRAQAYSESSFIYRSQAEC